MVVAKDEMNDSEIISLLSEYDFSNDEISKILKEIKDRDFESVLAFIEKIRTKQGKWQENDREKMLEELRKRQDVQKIEEERMSRYKTMLKEKIEANREEQKEREEQENKNIKVSEAPILIKGDVKVRILHGAEEFFFGFELSATVEDLYSKVAKTIGQSSFQLAKFGKGEVVEMSKHRICDQFKAKAVMFEVLLSK